MSFIGAWDKLLSLLSKAPYKPVKVEYAEIERKHKYAEYAHVIILNIIVLYLLIVCFQMMMLGTISAQPGVRRRKTSIHNADKWKALFDEEQCTKIVPWLILFDVII